MENKETPQTEEKDMGKVELVEQKSIGCHTGHHVYQENTGDMWIKDGKIMMGLRCSFCPVVNVMEVEGLGLQDLIVKQDALIEADRKEKEGAGETVPNNYTPQPINNQPQRYVEPIQEDEVMRKLFG